MEKQIEVPRIGKRIIVRENQALPDQAVVLKLREKADKDPAFKAIMHTFAMRERTRKEITVQSLSQAMKKDGFEFDRKAYQEAVKFMSYLKLGTLETSQRGKVKALRNIKFTLQSLGMASVSKMDYLIDNKEKKAKARKLVITDTVLKKPIRQGTLTLTLGHKTLQFDLFPDKKLAEVIDLIDRIYNEK